MITPVSFMSSYKVTAKGHDIERQRKFRQFQEFATGVTQHIKEANTTLNGGLEKKYPYFFQGDMTLSVPDSMDEMIENYCDYHKIEFQKYASNPAPKKKHRGIRFHKNK
ncbi:hypothetical protein IJ531_00535 [bacterium]|nr:hypothetical protein [bacterium]